MPHKNAARLLFRTVVPAGQQFYLHLDFFSFGNDLTTCIWKALKCKVFTHLIVLIFRAASFFSFEQRWVCSYWCQAAIDFYLEAEVKGALTTGSGLNVYWPFICDMVCIFKCVRMSWDHWRAASCPCGVEIEPRPVFILRVHVCFWHMGFLLCILGFFSFFLCCLIQHTDQHPIGMLSCCFF